MKEKIDTIVFGLQYEKSDKADIAQKILRTLTQLQQVPLLKDVIWRELARTKRKAEKRIVQIDYDWILKNVQKEWDKLFPDIGCNIIFWSEDAPKNRYQIGFHVGITNTRLTNVVFLTMRINDKVLTEDSDEIKQIISIVSSIWKVETIEYFPEKKEFTSQ